MKRAPADAGALRWTPRRRLVESGERETVLESLGADQDRGGAPLLLHLTLGPGGDELITLVGDAHRHERPDTRVGVVEACPEDRFGLDACHLPLCLAVVTARSDEGDESHDDHHGGDDEHPRVAGVLLRLAALRLGLRLGGCRAGRLVDGTGHF